MSNVVVVTDIAFWNPEYGSHARINSLVQALSERATTTVFLLRSIDMQMKASWNASPLSARVQLISYKEYSKRTPEYRRSLSRHPFFRGKEVMDFTASLEGYLADYPADVAIFEYVRLAYMADACPPQTTTILDTHDVMSMRSISLRQVGVKTSIEMTVRAESEILSRFDHVLAISDVDCLEMRTRLGLNNVILTPYPVMHSSIERPGAPPSGLPQILFLGARSTPNITGLQWFLDQVWPLVRGQGQLNVVGRVCEAFKDIEIPGVVFHGLQDDLTPFWRDVAVAINPVFVGGGIKIKTIDALAAGVPCVSTLEGAAGLSQIEGHGLYLARSREEFVSHLEALLRSPQHRALAGKRAAEIMQRTFSAEKCYAPLMEAIKTPKIIDAEPPPAEAQEMPH